jgi:hypothetical protein
MQAIRASEEKNGAGQWLGPKNRGENKSLFPGVPNLPVELELKSLKLSVLRTGASFASR